MRYTPKVYLRLRLPHGYAEGLFRETMTVREILGAAGGEVGENSVIFCQGRVLPLDRSVKDLGLVSDSELLVQPLPAP